MCAVVMRLALAVIGRECPEVCRWMCASNKSVPGMTLKSWGFYIGIKYTWEGFSPLGFVCI